MWDNLLHQMEETSLMTPSLLQLETSQIQDLYLFSLRLSREAIKEFTLVLFLMNMESNNIYMLEYTMADLTVSERRIF